MGSDKQSVGLLETLKMERVRTIFTPAYPYPHEHSRHAIIAVVVGCLFFISSDNIHTLVEKLDNNIKWWSMYGCLLGFFYFFSSPFIGKTIKPSYSNFSRWYIAWILVAAVYHLPSFQSMGVDMRMNLSMFLTIFISSILFLIVFHIIFYGLWYIGLVSRVAGKRPEISTILQNCAVSCDDAFAPLWYKPEHVAVNKPEVPCGVSELKQYDGPQCFVIPGNHDWFDGLNTFIRYICHKSWLGGWFMPQKKSYFALQLPKRWWVFGLDLALLGDIDVYQFKFFSEVVKNKVLSIACCVFYSHCGNRAILRERPLERKNSNWFAFWKKQERNTWLAKFLRMNELKDQVCSSWFAPVGSASDYPLLSKWVIYGELACNGSCVGSSDGISPIYSLWATFIGLYIANYVVERSTGWALTHPVSVKEYEKFKKKQMKPDFLDMVP
ncbi:hypothetical protein CFP56_029585 [Quercus suber]|uniref:Calcineurin-like phosphoesterase domain-containing protein n=1 Tax=Quercus suber TaxID=58331 RepID=A0AAW0JSB5_QUESU